MDPQVEDRRRDADRDGLVFATATGKRLSESNVRRGVVEKDAAIASAELDDRRTEPLPRLTPHSLRRTFATLL